MCKNNPKAILAGLALCFFGIQSSQAASILVTPSNSSIAFRGHNHSNTQW